MLVLPAVTVACIDCAQPALSLAALGQTVERVRCADVLFASNDDPEASGLTYVPCPAAATSGERLDILLARVAPRVATSHLLLVRWDAFVVNPDAWTPELLEYDCVTAAGRGDARVVDGIALLSLRLLRALGSGSAAAERLEAIAAGDDASGFRRAPLMLAERFAFSERPPVGHPFAVQGAFNLWMYLGPTQLESFLAMATPDVLCSGAVAALGQHLRALGRTGEAGAVDTAIARAGGARGLAQTAASTSRAPSGPSARPVGRNDPCPCGSGRKYKQCHGQLGAEPAVTAAASAPTDRAPSRGAEVPVPGALAVWLQLGRDALARDDAATARRHLERLVASDPEQAEALGLLAVIASRERRFDDAERLLAHALDVAPDAPELHSNRGAVLHARARFAEAAASYRRALHLDPGHVAACNNLGLALQALSDVEGAIAAFREAVRRAPSFADAHWNLGLALLLDGRYEEGLAEHEWRLSAAMHRAWWERRRGVPRWEGEPISGRRVLVFAEQGLGDMIHFARYAALLAARGATVIVEAAPALARLLSTVPGVAATAPLGGPYPACDVQIPMMSLPFAFHTRVDTIPAGERYVCVAEDRAQWASSVLGLRDKPRIGFAWAGNPQHVRDRFRSLPVATLAPLLAIDRCEWISLQKGDAARELAALPPSLYVRDCGAHARDFADLAALVDALDAVVTVDTALVHVAGALGKPAVVLVDSANDWRWMREGDASAWYPSVRIARQRTQGDWTDALAAAKRLLAEAVRL